MTPFEFQDDTKDWCRITLMRNGPDRPTVRGPSSTLWCFQIEFPDNADESPQYSRSVELEESPKKKQGLDGLWCKIRWLATDEREYTGNSWYVLMQDTDATRLQTWLEVCAHAASSASEGITRYHAQQPNHVGVLQNRYMATHMNTYQQDPSEILKDVIFRYYIIEGYEREDASKRMDELFNLLRDPPPPAHNMSHIQSFMEITQWIEVFPGTDNKSLRETMRAIQGIYWEHYGEHYGKGDLSTHNAYIIDTTMESVHVPEPILNGVYTDKWGTCWTYKGVSKPFGDFHFESLRRFMTEHMWISKEMWKQDPMPGQAPHELSPRGRQRPPIIRKTTPER